MKRLRGSTPLLKVGFFDNGFESDFIRELVQKYLPLGSVYALRATTKKWKNIIDNFKFYWERYAKKLAPFRPANFDTVTFYSLQGINDSHLSQLLNIFKSDFDIFRRLSKKILTSFLNVDTDKCRIKYNFSVCTQDFNIMVLCEPYIYTFIFIEGRSIHYRKDDKVLNFIALDLTKISVSELVQNYRDGIQYYGYRRFGAHI